MGFFKAIPRDIEEAAVIDGLSRFGAFIRVVVPTSISGLLTVVIFAFTLVLQEFVYGNTNGFLGGYRSSRHHIDCSVIGEDDGAMQRDYWYTAARASDDLESPTVVGRIAGERTIRRLNARQLGTLECPVIFEPSEAADPRSVSAFPPAVVVTAIHGRKLQKGSYYRTVPKKRFLISWPASQRPSRNWLKPWVCLHPVSIHTSMT